MKWICKVCGYVYEGPEAPEFCPQCKAPKSKFQLMGEETSYADEHRVGVAEGVDPRIIEGLRMNFNGECTEVGMYLAMSRQADRDGYPEVAEAFKRYAWEEAEHAAKFAELLGEVVTSSTKKNLELRAEAEWGATAGKKELATLANRVYLVASEPLPLHSPWLEKLRGFDNVVMLEGYTITDVVGSPYLEQMAVRAPDGRQQAIPIKGLFVEMGLIPNSDLVKGLVDLDELGRIAVNCRGETSCPGVYAAGDVTTSYAEQVLIAVGDGAKAVLSAYEYLLRWHQPARTRL